ncbi:Asp-tRNA(Asn)/Glu-tRNA(Gln) amidotransferase subunit GatB [Algisphaera agarilytica]|uniref:Aspartyl/glutamyl-tRNA(Asn/Gln) amidotransferase subunit B n=1 Tax=Algisphaera agarilytica TaxID=1385975 RepID=A0A7X0H441_9BACT|nr:Asp-tRNA(Asn)/Glu-tRNA(Gln) amidotransferase subunit GatB [Algisphaera agarilytica]MBB6428707.1 aspartyl-tRNA(Asn)/glutamyl-tRNA(Gln) amidotransferase subunit B [Algisphaera agarilytica]
MTYPDPGQPHGLTTQLIVGMEIHVELATRSKMWTTAPNLAHADYFDAEPNTLLDPVVIGMPGTLPVINRAAVEMSIKVGLALGCSISSLTKWDRKSYYYPDLPKNYQISQFDRPVCYDGAFDVPVSDDSGNAPDFDTKRIRITRAHLEEDAGKLLHDLPGGGFSDGSLVDLNRAGTPLLEIVTEPDFTSADDAVAFGQALRDVCRHLGVTEGIMQKGHMRFEPNINVVITKPSGEVFKTPVVEIKNLNSFKAVHGAIIHEHHRQVEQWLEDGRVMGARAKSTRGWDDVKLVTTPQREKEDADEYRYFPDPDLVTLKIGDDWLDRLRAEQPELPLAKKARYIGEYGLKPIDADNLLAEPANTRFFEDCVLAARADGGPVSEPRRVAAMLLNAGAKRANEAGVFLDGLGITPQQVADTVALQDADKISASAADTLFGHACTSDDPAEKLAEQHGLLQVSDEGQLDEWIDQILADPKNEKAIEQIKGGKEKAIGALLGQIMKLSKGQANPKAVGDKIKAKLLG